MQTLAFNYAGQHMIAIKQGQVTGWLSLVVHFFTTKMHPPRAEFANRLQKRVLTSFSMFSRNDSISIVEDRPFVQLTTHAPVPRDIGKKFTIADQGLREIQISCTLR